MFLPFNQERPQGSSRGEPKLPVSGWGQRKRRLDIPNQLPSRSLSRSLAMPGVMRKLQGFDAPCLLRRTGLVARARGRWIGGGGEGTRRDRALSPRLVCIRRHPCPRAPDARINGQCGQTKRKGQPTAAQGQIEGYLWLVEAPRHAWRRHKAKRRP